MAAGDSPDLGSGSVVCTMGGGSFKNIWDGGELKREISVVVDPGGCQMKIVGNGPKADVRETGQAKTVTVVGTSVDIYCIGKRSQCTYRIVQIAKP